MERRLVSKMMSALFTLTLQCETKAIFWHCTLTALPLSRPRLGKCAELRVLH